MGKRKRESSSSGNQKISEAFERIADVEWIPNEDQLAELVMLLEDAKDDVEALQIY